MERGRDTTIDTTTDAATARPTTVAFVTRFDATTFGRTVHLTPDEERRLRNVLAALRDHGFILDAGFEAALPGFSPMRPQRVRANPATPGENFNILK